MTIQNAVRAALDAAGVSHERVAVVGIGVAGAAASHSAGWLREVVSGVTPGARVVPSADYEIALVGALGRRRGVLILAGTGSLAYGVNARGRSALAGGGATCSATRAAAIGWGWRACAPWCAPPMVAARRLP